MAFSSRETSNEMAPLHMKHSLQVSDETGSLAIFLLVDNFVLPKG